MHVVHMSRGFHDYVSHLVNAISEVVDTSIVVSSRDVAIEKHLSGRVNVIRAGLARVSSPANIVGLFKLEKILRERRVDIVHIQSGVMWELFLRRFMRRVPWVVTCHDIVRHPSYRCIGSTPSWMLKIAVRVSQGVIVHSKTLAEQALREWNESLQSKLIRVIPHGILMHYGAGVAQVGVGKGRVLFFGTLDKYKGLEHLAKAWPKVVAQLPGAELIVAGKCMSENNYNQMFSDCPNTTLLLKHQSDAEVRALFKWADVLVLPYTEASQSGVLHLGMAFALPVVVTAVGGLPDVIQDGVNGLVVPPAECGVLAHAISRLLTDLPLRSTIIDATVELRNTLYSWRNIAELTVLYYQDLIKKGVH